MEAVRGAASRLGAALALSLLCACGPDDGAVPCGRVAAALDDATAGDVIVVGACRLDGLLRVPDGVTLRGAGTDATVVVAPSEGVALSLGAGARVEDLSVESAGTVGIEASTGGDAVTLEDVEVQATRGTAVRISGTGARLTRVTLVGPVTADNAALVSPMPAPEDTATHGLLLLTAGASDAPVVVEELWARGFARFGVLAIDSHGRFEGGGASDNLGVGLMARGGTLSLTDFELCRTLQGLRPLPAYAGVFTGDVELTTARVTACDNEGFGLLHDAARSVHVDLLGADNSEPALWAQRGGSFSLSGASSVLSGNVLAGLVVVLVPEVTVRDAQIDGTRLGRRFVADTSEVEAGDGIQVIAETTAGLRIESVQLAGNERVGVLLDLGSGATVEGGTLSDVSVEASGEQLGVVAQTPSGPIPSGGWDDDVTRLGDAAGNDAALTGRLGVVGIVGPMYLPQAD